MHKKTLFVIDAYNLIYRMFYAIPEMTTRSGQSVQAIFGVAKFLKLLAEDNPEASVVITTDVGQSFRAAIYSEYKGTRERMPDMLRSQIDGVFELFTAAGITTLSRDGYEADDIIGSIAHQHENNEYQIVIVSSDKDLCQFVRDGHVHIFDAMKRKFMKEKDVIEKFWVPVHQVCDYLAIVGDASDNIPGISGFGPKKAVDLLTRYGSLRGIYAAIWIQDYQSWVPVILDETIYKGSSLSEKLKEALVTQIDNAFLSQKLASIITDLDVWVLPETPFAPGVLSLEYIDLLKKYEFRSLIPSAFLSPKTEHAPITSHMIKTLQELEDLELQIWKGWSDTPVILSTDASGKIVTGYQGMIYVIDSKVIDCSGYITFLLDSEVELVWYDLKTDIRWLSEIQKPLQNESEGQGRLF